MSIRCGVCGKILGNEPRFPMENDEEMCKECWLGFQDGESSDIESNNLEESISNVVQNKEDFAFGKLEETSQRLKNSGHIKEAAEIDEYMNRLMDQTGDSSKIKVNGKEYQGSVSDIWSSYLKTICYIFLIGSTIMGAVIGGAMFSLDENTVLGVILGGGFGFIVGFALVAFAMLFITISENIAIMTDNTARILSKLDES